jgi:hypothetical protein
MFENQCAIRMGVALKDSGMNLRSYTGARCWCGKKHLIRVEQLARWLKRKRHEVGQHKSFKPGKNAREAVAGKTGIIVCRNFWGRGNQGDHIDLWDGITMRRGLASYMDRAEEVIFWQII